MLYVFRTVLVQHQEQPFTSCTSRLVYADWSSCCVAVVTGLFFASCWFICILQDDGRFIQYQSKCSFGCFILNFYIRTASVVTDLCSVTFSPPKWVLSWRPVTLRWSVWPLIDTIILIMFRGMKSFQTVNLFWWVEKEKFVFELTWRLQPTSTPHWNFCMRRSPIKLLNVCSGYVALFVSSAFLSCSFGCTVFIYIFWSKVA